MPDCDNNASVLAISQGAASGRGRVEGALSRITVLAFGLLVFVGALQLMKTAAASLEFLHAGILVANAGTTLGLGWLGALLVLSGSPVAATAMSLVAAGESKATAERFTELQGFTMLTGSRLGAAFVVLVTAVVWALREGRGARMVPLSTAVIALVGTAIVYVPAAIVGAALLTSPPLEHLDARLPARAVDLIDVLYGDLVEAADGLPAFVLFVLAIAALLVSFRIIDLALPAIDSDAMGSRHASLLERRWPMFGLGAAVALVTMSVSVALTVLVPLVARNVVRRESIVPYVFGANIATLGDTMVAAFALDSPGAVRIVLAEIVATTTVSVILLTFFYAQTRRAIWSFQRWVVASVPRLALFTAGLFLVPLSVIWVSAVVV